jgi:hypothetical protein
VIFLEKRIVSPLPYISFLVQQLHGGGPLAQDSAKCQNWVMFCAMSPKKRKVSLELKISVPDHTQTIARTKNRPCEKFQLMWLILNFKFKRPKIDLKRVF